MPNQNDTYHSLHRGDQYKDSNDKAMHMNEFFSIKAKTIYPFHLLEKIDRIKLLITAVKAMIKRRSKLTTGEILFLFKQSEDLSPSSLLKSNYLNSHFAGSKNWFKLYTYILTSNQIPLHVPLSAPPVVKKNVQACSKEDRIQTECPSVADSNDSAEQSSTSVTEKDAAASNEADVVDEAHAAINVVETANVAINVEETDAAEADRKETEIAGEIDVAGAETGAETDVAETDKRETDVAETDKRETDVAETGAEIDAAGAEVSDIIEANQTDRGLPLQIADDFETADELSTSSNHALQQQVSDLQLEILAYKEHILLLETTNHSNRIIESFDIAKQRRKEELSGLMSEIDHVKKRKHVELTKVDELSAVIKKLKDDRTTIEYDVQQMKTQHAVYVSDVKELDQKRSALVNDIESLESEVTKLNDTRKSAQGLHAAQHAAITTEMEHLNAEFVTMKTLKVQKTTELERLNEHYELTRAVLSKIGDQLKKVSE